jgi:hypothetical protein
MAMGAWGKRISGRRRAEPWRCCRSLGLDKVVKIADLHTEAAAIPTHRTSLLAQEAGIAGLRGGF